MSRVDRMIQTGTRCTKSNRVAFLHGLDMFGPDTQPFEQNHPPLHTGRTVVLRNTLKSVELEPSLLCDDNNVSARISGDTIKSHIANSLCSFVVFFVQQ